MESSEDIKNHKTNLMYFNQMAEERGMKKTSKKDKKKVKSRAKPSFASQKVDFSDYLLAPDGYESVIYPLYFLLIPYITGAVALFFLVAGASVENFKLLELNSFVIVWLIGYEIVATIMLISIFISFLKYDDNDMPQTKRHF